MDDNICLEKTSEYMKVPSEAIPDNVLYRQIFSKIILAEQDFWTLEGTPKLTVKLDSLSYKTFEAMAKDFPALSWGYSTLSFLGYPVVEVETSNLLLEVSV